VKAFRKFGRFDKEDASNRETEEQAVVQVCLVLCDPYEEKSFGCRGRGKPIDNKVAET